MLKAILIFLFCSLSLAQDLPPQDGAQITKITGVDNSTGLATNYADFFTDGSGSCRLRDNNGNLFTSHLVSGTDRSLDVDVRHSALPDGASTEAKQDSEITQLTAINSNTDDLETRIGATNESAAATDTSTSGLNGLFKRLLQRVTTLISFYAADFGASSGAIRTAAQVGNSTGAANFNSGATGAQTLRTASNLYDSAGNAITSRSYDSVRPLDVYVVQTGAANATHTLTTPTANVSTQIVAANSARKWLIFSNFSGANFFCKFGATAVANQGIQIPSNGGSYTMASNTLYTGAINCIVTSNNRTIETIEGY